MAIHFNISKKLFISNAQLLYNILNYYSTVFLKHSVDVGRAYDSTSYGNNFYFYIYLY